MRELLASRPHFLNRETAGDALGKACAVYAGRHALVLGLPRGGVVVAARVARALGDAELDVVVAKKIGAPGAPEFALGAVAAGGGRFLDERTIQHLGVTPDYLESASRSALAEARRQEAAFRGSRPAPRIAGRVVILVDDGIATGSTMRAAVRAVRQAGPGRVVVAAPVGAPETCAELRHEADDVICLAEPESFGSVGGFYDDFTQVDDRGVHRLLTAV